MIWRWHRQGQKTQSALVQLAQAAYQEPGTYAFVSPTYGMSRRIAWDGLRLDGVPYLEVIPRPLIVERNEAEMALVLRTRRPGKRSRILFLSADDPDRLRGLALRGCVLDEFATMTTAEPLHVVLPAIEAAGGWLLITSAPKGLNHFHELWKSVEGDPAWWLSVKTIEDTGLIAWSVVEQELREGQAREWVDQEYFVAFSAALVGSYFGDVLTAAEREGCITDLPHRPAWKVTTAWDIGISDLTVVLYLQLARDPGERVHVNTKAPSRATNPRGRENRSEPDARVYRSRRGRHRPERGAAVHRRSPRGAPLADHPPRPKHGPRPAAGRSDRGRGLAPGRWLGSRRAADRAAELCARRGPRVRPDPRRAAGGRRAPMQGLGSPERLHPAGPDGALSAGPGGPRHPAWKGDRP